MDPENTPRRAEYATPRPASSAPVVIAAGLAGILVGLLVIMFWPSDTTTNTTTTYNSTRVERAPAAPPSVKPPSDLTQPVPKAPAQ
jgi:hypothetical protein